MKKVCALLLALIFVVSLVACGGSESGEKKEDTAGNAEATEAATEAQKATKDDLLKEAKPITQEELEKAQDNTAFAKSLIGNTYTFDGKVRTVKDDYAVVEFYLDTGANSIYTVSYDVMPAYLYLPTDDLISIEDGKTFPFVAKLTDVTTSETSIDGNAWEIKELVFDTAYINK